VVKWNYPKGGFILSYSMKRARPIYFLLFAFLFLVEILIALYVRDDFVRPYVGDVLVTVLICSIVRALFLYKIKALPLWVFLFALAVEIGQYLDIVSLLRLDDIPFFSILIGTTFSFADIICYATGCLLFAGIEKIIKRTL